MATCWQKAHFFAQAAVETGYKLDVKTGEEVNFSEQKMYDIFPSKFFKGSWNNGKWQSVYNPNAQYKHTDNREFKDEAHSKKARELRNLSNTSDERDKEIANFIYANTNGNGDEVSGDGWRFRGSGLFQLTGRGNFEGVYEEIKGVYSESILTDSGADKVRTNVELAVLTSMGYFKMRKAHTVANGNNNAKDVCVKVGDDHTENGISKNHVPKINFFTNKSSILFKTKDCQWSKIEIPPLAETDVITYHIMVKGRKIIKQLPANNKYPNKRKYIYHDKNEKKHDIGDFELKYVPKIKQSPKGKIFEYPKANDDGNIEMIYIKDFKGYTSSVDNIKAAIGLWDSNQYHRWYINPECFAGLVGAMLDLNIDCLVYSGCSDKDGKAGGSVTHYNGVATDVGYLRKDKKASGTILQSQDLDLQLNVDFINALIDYGYKTKRDFYTEKFIPHGETTIRLLIDGLNTCTKPRHNNHLHIGGFDFTSVVNI